MAVTAEQVERISNKRGGYHLPENGRNGNGHGFSLVGLTTEILGPHLSRFRDFLVTSPYPRPYLHPDQFHKVDPECGLYEYTDGQDGVYAKMMFIAEGDPLKTYHKLASALGAVYTLRFIAAGAATVTGGSNSWETLLEQRRYYKAGQVLDEGFQTWRNQFKIAEPYFEQWDKFREAMTKMGQKKPIETEVRTEVLQAVAV